MTSKLRSLLPAVVVLCITTNVLFAQKTEISANGYAGLFSFYGNGSVAKADGYLNPNAFYGRKPAFSYSFGLQLQRVTSQQHLYGLAISIDKLRSYANTTLYTTDVFGDEPPLPPFKAKEILSNAFLTATPFIGQRFAINNMTLDIAAAADIAYYLKGYVIIKASSPKVNDRYSFERNDVTPSIDFRPGIRMAAGYNRFSVLLAYSLGVTNYRKDSYKASSSFLRLGGSYRLN